MCSIAQSCLALCDPRDCSPPGSSVHRILQARTLECIAISSREGLPNPGINASPTFPALAGRLFITEPLGKSQYKNITQPRPKAPSPAPSLANRRRKSYSLSNAMLMFCFLPHKV